MMKFALMESILPMIAMCLLAEGVLHAASSSPAPWEKPRTLTDFQSLLNHSPFCLPTAEESSPLADRYALTGIVTINGEEEVFVFDRTDQSRVMLSRNPNSNNMSLVSLVREGTDVPQKATIRVGADTGTIGYLEETPQPQVMQIAGMTGTAQVQPGRPMLPRLPTLPQSPGAPSIPGAAIGPRPSIITPPTRRIIRHPMISPPQATSSASAPVQ